MELGPGSEAIFLAIPDATLIVDAAGIIRAANPAAARIFGYPVVELVGTAVAELVPSAKRDGHGAHMSRFFAAGVAREMGRALELQAQRKDGTLFEVEIGLGFIELSAARYVICVARDVSDRRAMQRRLALTERVAAIGTLAAGVADEIRRPLETAAASLAIVEDQLRNGTAGSEAIGAAREASAACARANQIIEDIRTRADPAEGPANVDVNHAAEAAISIVEGALRHRGRVVRQLAAKRRACGNDLGVVRVLTQVLTDVARALPPDSVNSEVIVATRDEGDFVITTVNRADGGALVVPGGPSSAASYRLLGHMGGQMRLENRPAVGICIVVRLPAI